MSETGTIGTPYLPRDRTVSIIGAGPAGLTLARLLQMRGAMVRVFERDTSRAVRGQGGSLDLHEDSGQLALRSAGIENRFQAVARPDGQHTRILDRHGVLRAELLAEDEPQSRPEIDRGVLRDLLLDSLAPDTVIWDRQLLRVDRTEAARPLLVFGNAPAVEADLVVGCDGGRSKVRPLRSDLTPHYSGVTFVQTWVADADRRHPDLASFVGPGNVIALGDNKALMAQRNGDRHIRILCRVARPGGLDPKLRLRPYRSRRDTHRSARTVRRMGRAVACYAPPCRPGPSTLAFVYLPPEPVTAPATRCHAAWRRRAYHDALQRQGSELCDAGCARTRRLPDLESLCQCRLGARKLRGHDAGADVLRDRGDFGLPGLADLAGGARQRCRTHRASDSMTGQMVRHIRNGRQHVASKYSTTRPSGFRAVRFRPPVTAWGPARISAPCSRSHETNASIEST
jgi:hypothetical protein